MVLEFIFMLMEQNMKEIGKMIYKMVLVRYFFWFKILIIKKKKLKYYLFKKNKKELKHGLMDLNMKGNIRKEKKMVKEHIIGRDK